MSQTLDPAQLWSAAWQHLDARPAGLDLHKVVTRERWRLALVVVLETLVVIGTLGLAVAIVRNQPSLEGVLWIGSLVVFFAAATAFTIWNRRGLWSASAETTAAYVALRIDRCCARLLAVRFGVALALVESVFMLGWHLARAWMQGVLFPAGILKVVLLLVAVNAIVLVSARYYGQRARRELDSLRGIRAALGGVSL